MAHMGDIFFFSFSCSLSICGVFVCKFDSISLSLAEFSYLGSISFSHRCDICHLISFTPKQAPVTVVFGSLFRIPIFNLVDKAHCCSICLPNNYFCHMHKSCRCFFLSLAPSHFWPFFTPKFVYRISGNKLKTETIRFVLNFCLCGSLNKVIPLLCSKDAELIIISILWEIMRLSKNSNLNRNNFSYNNFNFNQSFLSKQHIHYIRSRHWPSLCISRQLFFYFLCSMPISWLPVDATLWQPYKMACFELKSTK